MSSLPFAAFQVQQKLQRRVAGYYYSVSRSQRSAISLLALPFLVILLCSSSNTNTEAAHETQAAPTRWMSYIRSWPSEWQQKRHSKRRLQGLPLTNQSIRDAVKLWLHNQQEAEATYGIMAEWDTSQVTDMNRLFEGAIDFNSKELKFWNTASVTSFSYMFAGCRLFDQSLESWDFSSAQALDGMFNGALSYNQDMIGGGWTQTSKVTNTAAMFKGATYFNGDVSGLDTSNVEDMSLMFYLAASFQGKGIETWDVSKVVRMDRLFMSASSFDGDVREWTPRSATTMFSMFEDAVSFSRDISGWHSSLSRDLINLSQMFYHAQSFDHKLCWPNLDPRVQASKMFCGSPGVLHDACFTPSVLHWAESCTAKDLENNNSNNNNNNNYYYNMENNYYSNDEAVAGIGGGIVGSAGGIDGIGGGIDGSAGPGFGTVLSSERGMDETIHPKDPDTAVIDRATASGAVTTLYRSSGWSAMAAWTIAFAMSLVYSTLTW